MSQDHTVYVVTRPEETRGLTAGPSSFIPSTGVATTAVDQYRVVGIHSTNYADLGVAFTDIAAAIALSKIAEGGISSIHDLERAEMALQAILLHNIVHLISPAPKVDFGNGFISYERQDIGARTQFAFDLFALAKSRDFLIAPEFLKIEGAQVVSSTLPKSIFLKKTINEINIGDAYWSDDVCLAINSSVSQHGIPAYLTDPRLLRTRRGDGFHKRFYSSLNISWNKAIGDLPPVHCTFSMPPLLSIVLDRMSSRNKLLETLISLRDELAPVRAELIELNQIVTSSANIGEIVKRTQHITQSFDAIISESMMSRSQKIQRRFAVVQGLVRPIINFMAGFVMKTGTSYEDIIASGDNLQSKVLESRSIIDRTVTAKMFSHLVNIESLQNLVKFHFSNSEINAIEISLIEKN